MDLFSFDRTFRCRGFGYIAGVDEAGRGPWAGPVVASAFIFPACASIDGLNDSKKLSPLRREKLFDEIQKKAEAVGIGIVGQETIDSENILRATHLAMKTALLGLGREPELVLVDGWPVPELPYPQEALVGGDGRSASIAAASIIAKVTRDRIMVELSTQYPQYKFHIHKGYGTREHSMALLEHGPCPVHRKSFAPVRKLLERQHVQ